MNNGWIKLHREMLEWEWYDHIPTKTIFIHCLLKANYKDKKWRGIQVKRGSFITSRSNLSNETGLSEQQVRTALNNLETTSDLTINTTNHYTHISVNQYDHYQQYNQQDNQQPTNNQPATNHKSKNVRMKESKKYTIHAESSWDGKQPIDYASFVDKFNALYDRQLHVTDKKRGMIRARLRTYTGEQILKAWQNRLNDPWLNSEGKKHLGRWKAAMRNDEKIDQYLNVDDPDGELSDEELGINPNTTVHTG